MSLYSLAVAAEFPNSIDPEPTNSAVISTVSIGDQPTVILSANPARKGFSIFNKSGQTIYLGIDTLLTKDDHFFAVVPPNYTYEWSFKNSFIGEVFGITETFSGGADVQAFSLN